MTISGAMMTYPIIATHLQSTAHGLSLGPGIFGWTAIQVHANMVVKQLQIMCHINLVPNILSQWAKTDEEMSVGMSESVGRAQANVRYSKVKRIILPSRCGELVPKNIVEPCIYVNHLHNNLSISCGIYI